VDWDEPDRVAQSILRMKVKHAVITSVDRDDLADGGSILWTETIQAIRRISPLTTMETLIPDFKANTDQLDRVIAAKPEIISHNLETVRRLTRQVRIQAQYDRSLETLTYLKAQGTWRTKSGIMLGLGETEEEVLESMMDLRKANVDVVTMGQYLQPTPKHLPVKEFVHPDVFNRLAEAAKTMGFIHVESGPLVRSSYHAEKHIR
jgi:lipoic acid synthetase